MPSARQTVHWPLLLQGLINWGIGVKSRRAGFHKFGRVMGGDGTQRAGGGSVRDAGHDRHDFRYLLF